MRRATGKIFATKYESVTLWASLSLCLPFSICLFLFAATRAASIEIAETKANEYISFFLFFFSRKFTVRHIRDSSQRNSLSDANRRRLKERKSEINFARIPAALGNSVLCISLSFLHSKWECTGETIRPSP